MLSFLNLKDDRIPSSETSFSQSEQAKHDKVIRSIDEDSRQAYSPDTIPQDFSNAGSMKYQQHRSLQ
jgi:hypothetical protein